MTQVHYICCALYFYYYYVSSTSIRSWSLGTPVLTHFTPTMAPWVKRRLRSWGVFIPHLQMRKLRYKGYSAITWLSQESETASCLRAGAPVSIPCYPLLCGLCALMHQSSTVAGHSAISLHWRAYHKQIQDITTGFPVRYGRVQTPRKKEISLTTLPERSELLLSSWIFFSPTEDSNHTLQKFQPNFKKGMGWLSVE